MVREDSGIASSSTLLAQLNTLQRKMTGKAAQDLLITLTKDHWFVEVRRDMALHAQNGFFLYGEHLPSSFGLGISLNFSCMSPIM